MLTVIKKTKTKKKKKILSLKDSLKRIGRTTNGITRRNDMPIDDVTPIGAKHESRRKKKSGRRTRVTAGWCGADGRAHNTCVIDRDVHPVAS